MSERILHTLAVLLALSVAAHITTSCALSTALVRVHRGCP